MPENADSEWIVSCEASKQVSPFFIHFRSTETTLYLAQTLREKTLMTLREAKKVNLMSVGL